MDLFLDYTHKTIQNIAIKISGSKSESNRLLILQQFYPNLELQNVSDSDDTKHLQEALASKESVIDIGHAGTAMRFLTAYFSAQEGREVTLTGSQRMQNRPVKILVDALQSLGADIAYVDKDGFPPLRIKGKKITKNNVRIQGNVSSQYISALLLIAPTLENGLELELLGKITSIPYIKMTLALLHQLGIKTKWEENVIHISPKKVMQPKTIVVESDWSSASYFYSLIALSEKATVKLSSYHKNSLQGDNSLIEIYKHFGVTTTFDTHSIILSKDKMVNRDPLILNLVNSPDLAQTIAVTCFGLGIACDLMGLHTLKIKETDRLVALKNELEKLDATVEITNESLHLKATSSIKENVEIATYDDHRMAMAFAPLSLKVSICIKDADVVTKSFTGFWEDLDAVFK
jgi:3-phosphoshikimate 1-carboxyvinyltransferase